MHFVPLYGWVSNCTALVCCYASFFGCVVYATGLRLIQFYIFATRISHVACNSQCILLHTLPHDWTMRQRTADRGQGTADGGQCYMCAVAPQDILRILTHDNQKTRESERESEIESEWESSTDREREWDSEMDRAREKHYNMLTNMQITCKIRYIDNNIDCVRQVWGEGAATRIATHKLHYSYCVLLCTHIMNLIGRNPITKRILHLL